MLAELFGAAFGPSLPDGSTEERPFLSPGSLLVGLRMDKTGQNRVNEAPESGWGITCFQGDLPGSLALHPKESRLAAHRVI